MILHGQGYVLCGYKVRFYYSIMIMSCVYMHMEWSHVPWCGFRPSSNFIIHNTQHCRLQCLMAFLALPASLISHSCYAKHGESHEKINPGAF